MIGTTLAVTPSLADILLEVEAKQVSARQHPDDPYLWIFNYTPRVQFDRLWNPVNKACRGLILRLNGPLKDPNTTIQEVVSLPWAKFFNVGEDGLWPTAPVTDVTEKMDGSLGILYRTQRCPYDISLTKYAISTRGSFVSEQAVWATKYLNSQDGYHHRQLFDLSTLPDEWTLLFEIISPVSHVVVDYPFEGLVLLGVRNRLTGEDLPWERVIDVADEYGFGLLPSESVREDSVTEFYDKRHLLGLESEGWVLRCEDGSRWKIKGEDYRRFHSLLSRLSERYVIDRIADGTIDDLLARVPEPYTQRVRSWHKCVQFAIDIATGYAHGVFNRAPRNGTRKDFALWVMEHYPSDRAILFSLYDQRSITPLLLKFLRETADTQALVSAGE